MSGAGALASRGAATPARQSDRRFDELVSLVSAKMTEHHVPGVAFGVMKNGQVTTHGFGVTNIEDFEDCRYDSDYESRQSGAR